MRADRPASRIHPIQRAVACVLVAAMTLPAPLVVSAANHPMTAVVDVNTIDYVVNVDWDYDSPPTQVSNPSQVLDRAYITSVMRVVAQSIYTMTEGKHRLGNVFVYKNKKFGSNVDIQLINKDGRSSANAPGWGVRDLSSFNHLAMSGVFESIDAVGKVIAHELGHYTYGLYDEYVEEGRALDPTNPSSPSQVDTPKDTIMHNHLQFLSLSTPADYTDPTRRQTAQARTMATGAGLTGGSAWETLTRTPDKDPEAARPLGRTFFEAFRGIDPNTIKLTQPVTGFDAKLNMVFAPAPVFRDVIVVDRTLPAERLADLIQAAKAMVSQADADTEYAIVTSPAIGTGPLLGYTAASIEGKKSLTQALDALQPVTSGTFDALAAFTQAFNLMAAARKTGDPATIHLLTGSETSVPAESAATARTARVAVNALGMTGGTAAARLARKEMARKQSTSGTTVNLAQLAKQTGGSYNTAKDAAGASKDAIKAVKESHSEIYAVLGVDASGGLAAGGQYASTFKMASGSTDGDVTVAALFDPSDASRLSFTLTAPDGKSYTPTTLPSGITFVNDASEGVVEFVVASSFANRTGTWTLTTRASAASAEGVAVEVSSNATVGLSGTLEGGTPDATVAPILRVRLGGEKSIKGAVVTADIYNEDGDLVLSGVTLRDDGVSPDPRGGDGQYTVSLSGRLPAGEYFALVTAQTNANSRIASLGALIKGARDEELPVEALVRVAEVAFALEAGALGVTTAATTTPATTPTVVVTATPTAVLDSGGGCTTSPDGRDAGLLALMLAALAGLFLRRRPAQSRPQGRPD